MQLGTILGISALAITIVMSAYVFLELQKINEINKVNLYYDTLFSEQWNEWTNWELANWNASRETYKQKWTEQITEVQRMDASYLTDIGRLVYP